MASGTTTGADGRPLTTRELIAGIRFMTAQDARIAWHHLRRNSISSSPFVPRILRYVLYRAAGIRTESPNIFAGVTFRGSAEVRIGARTFVNHGTVFEANAPITIGSDTHVAMECLFVTSDHPFGDDGRFANHSTNVPITVGDRCWLGARVTVLPGVTIGDGVVVAAGAVVTKDCAPHGLYGGVPARRLRDLSVAAGADQAPEPERQAS
jgi:maltose O-acetyltransferase